MRWGCKFSFLRRAQVLYFFKYRVERRKREKNKVRDDSNVALEWIKILVFFLRYRIIKIYLYVVDVKVKEFHGGNEKRGNE